jgi:hypothetical protein
MQTQTDAKFIPFFCFGVQFMPLETIWLKIGNADVRCLKKKVANALTIQEPLLVDVVDGKPIKIVRVPAKAHWELIGTGEMLQAETVLKNEKGEVIPTSAARFILEKTHNVAVDEKSNEVDKTKITTHLLNPDLTVGEEVAPFPPTDRIEIEQGDWVPSTFVDQWLVSEEYELPAADPRNDAKLWKEAEEALKRDEVAMKTFSNGGFTQYYCFLAPCLKEGKFVWVLKLTNKQLDYRQLRDIPAPATAALREVKTVQTLPPIQAIITVPKKK